MQEYRALEVQQRLVDAKHELWGECLLLRWSGTISRRSTPSSAITIPTAAPLEGRYGDNAVLAMEFTRTADELAAVVGHDPPSASEAASRARLEPAHSRTPHTGDPLV